MGETTKMQWCDHTFNTHRGCTRIAAGCANCYAAEQAKRNTKALGVWGPNGTRPPASESAWKEVFAWNRKAAAGWCPACKGGKKMKTHESGYGYEVCPRCNGARNIGPHRRRVFCGSMMDVFEDWPELVSHRARLFNVISETTELDWLLLTKRPQNVLPMVTAMRPLLQWEDQESDIDPITLPNVWLGFSASTQADLDAGLTYLLKCPARVRFLSLEPLLEAIDLSRVMSGFEISRDEDGNDLGSGGWGSAIDWVIVGGESGPQARPCNVEWIRSIVEQCKAAGVPCFVKQDTGYRPGLQGRIPDDLWSVKEFPRAL